MTLVEVLAVVVILGLLAGTITYSMRGSMGRAKREIARTGIATVVGALETYAIEQGRIPTMDEGLALLTEAPQGRGQAYLKPDQLRDPWGNAYVYVAPGPSGAYQVLSYGADGKLGGAAGSEDEDLTSDQLGGAANPQQTQGGGG